MSDQSTGVSRRAVLGSVGTAGAVTLAGCGLLSSNGEQSEDSGVTLGVAIPEDGRWANEGQLLQAGYLLATQDLNSGSGAMAGDGEYDPPFGEVGGGLLGETVELAVANTSSTGEGAQQAVGELLENDATMITGGGSAAEGLGLQSATTDEETVYMSGFTPTNQLGGRDCSRFGFNTVHNSRLAVDALAEVMPSYLPESERTFAQVYPESDFGEELLANVEDRLSAQTRFRENRAFATQVGAGSYADTLEDVLATQVSVIVLNFTGLNGAIALRDLAELAAERGREDIYAVVPLMTRELLRNAGGALTINGNNVLGTVPWTPNFDDAFSTRFVESWDAASVSADLNVAEVPSALSYLAYVQLYQYAGAVERAGNTNAEDVIAELEDQEFSIGPGTTTMRACDHQAMGPVPVVEGLPDIRQSPGEYTDLVDTVDVAYDCESGPASNCEL